jgi:hypothetical protein
MMKLLARWWARRRYIWKQDFEATLEELQAALSAQRAQEKRDAAVQLRKNADDMEARVKQMAEMEEKGFWLCENGHEKDAARRRLSIAPSMEIAQPTVVGSKFQDN